ncbi:MAG: hypothetical protein WC914_05410 [Proteiniphilum sp.]
MHNKEELQKYIEKRIRETGIGTPTIEDLNRFVGEWMQIENNRPLAHFEGYSPTEMHYILHDLFGKNCPVQLADFNDEDCDSVSLFRQVKKLLEMIEKEENLKLTQIGNLPPRIVKEVYLEGASEPHIQSGIIKLRREKDSVSVQMARIAVELMRVVKKRNNILSLTKKGKELMKSDSLLLSTMLTTMFTIYNPAYFDSYSSENIGVVGLGFNLVLLHKYGKKAQRDTFYSDKYFRAFPSLVEEVIERYRPREATAAHCYIRRVFDVLFYHLGLVTIDESDRFTPNHTKLIRRTPLFDTLFTIKNPR